MADLIESVGGLLREVAATVVLPMYQHLAEDDVEEKAPGDLVTVADRRAEERISAGLLDLLPDSVVVGEEGVADDPAVLRRLREPGPVWLVDPIDGTGNFAGGRGPFAMMVALLRGGAPVAGWIYQPLEETLAVAELGSGAYVDGVRATPNGDVLAASGLRGAATTRYLPQDLRTAVRDGSSRISELLRPQHCAGREYVDIVTGRQHFVIFWRTLPWDHAPGALMVEEIGGVVRRIDGAPYDLADDRYGLLACASEAVWDQVRAVLLS
ncbi:inositol monophosphatase family protein [Phytohabitans aurantiacus]|uniref:Inositol monophosphatase n=1 Tax=Phytohabitans aurantiacus TaxID=3016789 RepID=A0ABQ5QU49_9ACTN|nr:inositol monophosphatase family protein [Phytohabitans aurantiacus]GLH97805.1 inositol monophosphatase [Phytohabitans aurantiacus]